MSRAILQAALAALTFAVVTAFAGTAASKTSTLRSRWPAENLSGQIDLVDTTHHLLIVKDSNGTTFDFEVTPATRIKAGAQKMTLADLSSKANGQVKVHFVPERKGDIARTIELGQ